MTDHVDTTGARASDAQPVRLPASARVLVTGAAGFIGSHLVRRLVADGNEVFALTSAVSSVYPVRLVDLRDRITLVEGSLTDRSAMDAVVASARPTHVLHLGAYTHVGKSWQRVDECVQVNVQGTVNLLEALDGSGYERFVNTGTSEIYGDVEVPFREDRAVRPASPYASSKYAAELFCRVFHDGRGWPIVMLRPFNAYGPAQTADRIIPEVIVRALRGEDLLMTSGRQTREFNFVEDLVDGMVRAAVTPGVEGQLFNLGCEEDVAIRDVATLILDLMGNPVEARFGALPDRPIEIWEMRCDATRARETLGWKPQHSLADGLEKTIAWYREELSHPSSLFVAS
ncbi:MAG TPA: SDR family NAD(P)-dependent oxidoreductase [Acidimicrobiales bacterium]|nr:SDR family NAD(P)-dependent oxidoreductase [Acidimicrobiales bacterium]